jgi:signal transduction histidine kinase
VKIQVIDNGIGFDPQYADKLFTLFQRLHPARKYEGTGIGLALCKKIVSNHHGSITADSKPGVGTTFTILLPKGHI